MTGIRGIRKAVADPSRASHYVGSRVSEMWLLLSRRRPAAAAAHSLDSFLGTDVYGRYLAFVVNRLGIETVIRPVNGREMVLTLGSGGTSRDLFVFGTREQRLTERFGAELAASIDGADDPVILDLGSNIGYYVVQEIAHLNGTERGEIHAFEPEPDNLDLLRKNVALHDRDDRVTVVPVAVGDRPDERRLSIGGRSTEHRIDDSSSGGETIDVTVTSVDAYLDDAGIDPDRVVAVRMDVEGYEERALRGMEGLFEAADDLLLFVEIHPKYLDDPDELYDRLLEHEVEPLLALPERITSRPLPRAYPTESIDDLRGTERSYGLIARS